MRVQLLIISLTFNFNLVFSQEQELNISKIPLTQYFDASSYNGGIQNWSFDLDSSGVLFVSNNYGLLEYDGSNWENHHVPNTTKLRSVNISKNNRIYIGGQGQIGYFMKTKFGYSFFSLLEKLPPEKRVIEEVWKIIELNGVIYFNTSNRLLAFQNEDLIEIELPGQIQRIFKVKSKLIVQILDLGLFTYSNDTFDKLNNTSGLNEVISIIEYDEGFICFLSNGTISRYSNNQLKNISTTIDQFLKSATINTSLLLSNGDIAIGTQNEGLFILDHEYRFKNHFTKNKGLNNRTVLSIMEDDFKNLWVGLNNGINYLELSSPLSLINEDVGLEGTGYVAKLFKNRIYLGTNNGLFSKSISAKDGSSYHLIEGSQGQVYNLSEIDDQLILNHHRGAFEVNGQQLNQFHNTGSWKFIESSKDNLVIAGGYDGITVFNKNNWESVSKVDDLDVSSRILAFENDSMLWMTHGYKGAYLIELNQSFTKTKKIDFYGEKQGFPSNILISVYRVGENLIFTGETGIFNFNSASKKFTPNEFLTEWLGNEHVSNITSSQKGDIFFISDRELGYLKQESFGSYQKEKSVFKRINKLLSDDLENISIIDDKNILIGAKEGFIHFDPTKDFELKEDFNVIIKEAEIKFKHDSIAQISGDFLNDIQIEKNNSIKFKFASPYFDGAEDLQYSYRLKGFNEKWSGWSPETSKEYTNLPSGKFTFEVKARNIYESQSIIARKQFKILSEWYETDWAYMSYGASIIILFIFISLAQNKKHQREKEQINLSRDEAIKNKDEELSQFSRQSKEEIEHLKNEKLRSEISYKNNELASVTMHLLNKNEFVQGVKKRMETIVNEGGSSKDELKKIIKTIDRNIQEDDSWDQFAFHFDQVHGDFLKKLSEDKIKLTGQETKLAAYLRMNMSSKEIANLMNISVRGVELARYRLRKKLDLDRSVNLVEHLMEV